MTKTAPKGATTFRSDDGGAPPRPTTTIQIGSRTYTVRAPKMNVWMTTGFMLERLDKGQQAQQRLDSDDIIAAPVRRELEAVVAAAPEIQEVHELLVDGRLEGDRINGGFLRRCLSAEDYARVAAEMDDEESDLDIPDLYQAAFALYTEFEPWCVQRAEAMGLATPKAAAAERRKRATTR